MYERKEWFAERMFIAPSTRLGPFNYKWEAVDAALRYDGVIEAVGEEA